MSEESSRIAVGTTSISQTLQASSSVLHEAVSRFKVWFSCRGYMNSPSPLRYPLFRALWVASLIANTCFWMQSVGAAWLMVTLSGSALMVALIQTAISLPAFFFGLPAGVLADLLSRRWLLVAIHVGMLLVGILLVLLGDLLAPWGLLALVFLMGVGTALSLPTCQASIADTVPKAALVPAIAINSVAYNAARALGPAIAGLVIVRLGVEAVFILNLAMLLFVLGIFIFRYKPRPVPVIAPERMSGAMATGLRFIRHAQHLHGYLYRAIAFVGCASALWALLPLLAVSVADGSSAVYGYLLACLGLGAVVGGLLLNRMRAWFTSFDALLRFAAVSFAGCMLAVAWLPVLPLVGLALVVAGLAWIAFSSTLNAAFQSHLPSALRARSIAVLLLAFQGAMALGGLLWGGLAEAVGVPRALSVAALCIGPGLLWAHRHGIATSLGVESRGGE
ncbi:MFS transporter [Pseudomonas sp. GD03721]|nr:MULTISPECIES: MFS transporter [unclassified Pseudomonas]MDH1440350.1 MFS transporter [Pseudomonas sp. GD03722]WGG03560.1 MFS transporter [Pseudomonas sp. GD03721]WGG07728.1 MFS transporter [Pseudomonas sp. GD03919]